MGILLAGQSGLTGIKAKILRDDGTVYNGAGAMVDPLTLSSAEILAAYLSCPEHLDDDGNGLGTYAPDPAWPVDLDTEAVYGVTFYASPTSPSDPPIGYQDDPTGYIASQVADIYHAEIELTIDDDNNQDEYTAVWFKNGLKITSGITSPTIQVVQRDDSDLVAVTPMTAIGSGGLKYNEASNRVTEGEAVEVRITATIDGSSRAWSDLVGRDSD